MPALQNANPLSPLAAACAGILMFSIGFNTEFASVLRAVRPRKGSADFTAFAFILAVNLFVVPILAVIALRLVPGVPPIGVLGIMIMSASPGGPIANVVAVITGANVSLNAVCTAIEHSFSIVLMPYALLVVMPLMLDDEEVVRVPYHEVRSVGLGLRASASRATKVACTAHDSRGDS
jgi:predicted Na+-dependent transporter